MTKIIDGKAIAGQIRAELKKEVTRFKEEGREPGLTVILVGDNSA